MCEQQHFQNNAYSIDLALHFLKKFTKTLIIHQVSPS